MEGEGLMAVSDRNADTAALRVLLVALWSVVSSSGCGPMIVRERAQPMVAASSAPVQVGEIEIVPLMTLVSKEITGAIVAPPLVTPELLANGPRALVIEVFVGEEMTESLRVEIEDERRAIRAQHIERPVMEGASTIEIPLVDHRDRALPPGRYRATVRAFGADGEIHGSDLRTFVLPESGR